MYQIDTNINTAIQRQADQVRAVQAFGSDRATEPVGPAWTSVALAVVAPIILIAVLGLMLH